MLAMDQTKEGMTPKLVHQLEYIEQSYWMRYYQNSGSITSYSTQIKGTLACAVPSCDILALNRVLGINSKEPLNQVDIDNILRFYQKAGSKRFFIQLSPFATTRDQIALLESNGFRHHNNWTKLYRKVDLSEKETNSMLKVRTIGMEDAELFGQIIFMSFDWDDSRLPFWLAASVGQHGYTHYVVEYEGKSIAAAALFVEGKFASMAFAGTLPQFRGLGAQTLLLQTRLNEAFTQGAEFITAETGEPTSDRPVKSYDNMIGMGFELAYLRQNWLFKFE